MHAYVPITFLKPSSTSITTPIMRAFILPLLSIALLSFNPAQPKKKAKKIYVSGTVTTTSNYCGGASPNDEILTQLATPRAIANKKIYIKKGNINSLDSKVLLVLTTDAKGNFRTKLRPGKYLVVDSTKKDIAYYNMLLKTYKDQTTSYEAIDTVCLKEWFMKPACIFEVTGTETKNINVNFHKTCDDIPCSQFRGPFRE